MMSAAVLVFGAAFKGSETDSPAKGLIRVSAVEDWSAPVDVSGNLGYYSYSPQVATSPDGRKAYIVWVEEGGGSQRVYFQTNESGAWRPGPVNFSVYEAGEKPQPRLAVDNNGYVPVVFQARLSGNYETIYRRWKDGKFEPNENVSKTPTGGSNTPTIAVDKKTNDYIVVYYDDFERVFDEQVYFKNYVRYKVNGEGAWLDAGKIEDVTARSYCPSLAIDRDGRAYVAWDNRADINVSHVWFTQSDDPRNSSKWRQHVDVSGFTAAPFYGFATPQLAADNQGNVYVTWEDGRDGLTETYFRKRIDGQWRPMENLSKSAGSESKHQAIAVNRDTGDIYVAWAEQISGNNYDIFFREYTNGAWRAIQNLTKNSSWSDWPALFVDDTGTVHLVYADEKPGNSHVFYQYKMSKAPAFPPANLTLNTSLVETDPNNPVKANTLTWENDPRNGVRAMKSYKIYRKESGQADGAYVLAATVDGAVFEFADSNLPTAKAFTYRMSAVSLWDEESADFSAAVTEARKVFAPRSLSLETGLNKYLFYREKINTLKWRKHPLNDALTISSYKVYRKSAADEDSAYQAVATTSGTTLEYRDRKLSRTETYQYRLTSVDSQGRESAPSEPVSESE